MKLIYFFILFILLTPGVFAANATTITTGTANNWNGAWFDSNITHVQTTGNLELQMLMGNYTSRFRLENNTFVDENTTTALSCTISGAYWNPTGGLTFASTNDIVTCSILKQFAGMNSFTMYFDMEQALSDATPRYIMAIAKNDSTYTYPYKYLFVASSNNLETVIRANSANDAYRKTANSAFPLNTRKSLVTTWDGGLDGSTNIMNYVNNVLSSGTYGIGTGLTAEVNPSLYFGNSPDPAARRPFRGTLHEIMLWNNYTMGATARGQVVNKTKFTIGNVYFSINAGAWNETYEIDTQFFAIAMAGSYTLFYRTNGTGAWTQLGLTDATGNQELLIPDGSRHNNTDFKIEMHSDGAAGTPLLSNIIVKSQGVSGGAPPLVAPSILTWGNDCTNDNSLTIIQPIFKQCIYNITTDQAQIQHAFWTNAVYFHGGTYESNATTRFTASGTYDVGVYMVNGNGSSAPKNWTVTVKYYPELRRNT